ncbi:hypothetical protein SETIT_9G015700v2 [Setaria italica]|uniref:PGG domain-containing protein n=1 Tax=Setaria italica TaxID=4555 RepID=A0A368SC24_SETIT|nr:protein ACCELERATED CELL DEATH 6 [Setaria italica]XP_004981085.1 protein ACCELERATED CELL DEATH 6 [Setaria italica]RCV39991.1 hypothetical protein SETIT_9G015700v2 [Setaria italica]RCV39992.1 hypothetical protein SETIT_9G015700v2 [Setaria italica]RCV39993.1 hypothetical protein SETIT_9G015700v2 [Setaria italica]
MASSNGGQPAPQMTLVSMAGAREDHTFASYIEQRKHRHGRQSMVMYPMLRRVFCRHCRRWSRGEDHTLTPCLVSSHDVEQVPEPVDELALEVRSCFRCAQEICEKTRYLRDEAPASRGRDTPLHQAARSRNLTMFCHLVTLVGEEGGHGLVVQALRKTNDRKETALHVAVRIGDRDMVELMLWVDPQLGQIACHYISPIYLAVSLGRKDIAEALHDASGPCHIVSYSGPSGRNALHAAVLHGDEMTKSVLAWSEDLTKQDNNGSTPLHFAVSVQQRPFISFGIFGTYTWSEKVPTWQLLDADSSMAYREDDQGLLPVHIAAMTNQNIAIRILLRRCPGCMGLRDEQGRTFLHVAVQNKASRVVSTACKLKQCAPIMNIQDEDGNTALHLAVDNQNISMVIRLLRNQHVCLNLRNAEGQTELDLARSRIREGFFFRWNPDKVIYRMLVALGAKHGNDYRWDRLLQNRFKPKAGDDAEARKLLEKEESDKLTSSTQTLSIGSVLIATVTFGASFALPGGNIADDHPNGGSPTLAGRWYFDAFVVANTLAFLCSSLATVGLMFSGMGMVTLPFRRLHFNISLLFASSAVTSLTAAFALGVYMVLAPVARSTAIAICAISPVVLLYRSAQDLWRIALVSGILYRRRGLPVWLMYSVQAVFGQFVLHLWPFAVIFGWAGYLRERRHG